MITKFQDIVKSFYLLKKNGHFDKDASDNLIDVFNRTGFKDTVCGGLNPTHDLKKEMENIFNRYQIFRAVEWYDVNGPKIVQKYLELEEKALTLVQTQP